MFILNFQFSDPDKAEFATITANSILAATGTFEDYVSIALRSCKVVQ